MDEYEALSHTTWDCKIPRRLHPEVPNKDAVLGASAASRRGIPQAGRAERIEDRGRALDEPDHVHMLISIPPKYAVSQVVEFIKGKSAIHLARVYGERKRKLRRAAFLGQRVLHQHRGAR